MKVKNGRVSLDLPLDFHTEEVEVIVLSKDEHELPDDFELSDEQKPSWMSDSKNPKKTMFQRKNP